MGLRIGFVIPWFGYGISGGAESECYSLVSSLIQFFPQLQVEVLTTALKEFSHDWNCNFHQPGLHQEHGIAVRRFNADPVDRRNFANMNNLRLTPQTVDDLNPLPSKILSPLTPEEEREYLTYMVHSEQLYTYLKSHGRDYNFFVFMPYMFGTTVIGSELVGNRALVIPCLHNERYAYMQIYRKMMQRARACLFHVEAEMAIAKKLYKMKSPQLLGEMVKTLPNVGIAETFRQRFSIEGDFVLYAGRKIRGKGVADLVDHFQFAKRTAPELASLKLVLIGKGDLDFTQMESHGIYDLGFVTEAEKLGAMAAASVFCMPSLFESFSIVIMEAWLQLTPVLVNKRCDVTYEHIQKSNGGMAYDSPEEFTASLSILLNKEQSHEFAKRGQEYVLAHYTPKTVATRFVDIISSLKA